MSGEVSRQGDQEQLGGGGVEGRVEPGQSPSDVGSASGRSPEQAAEGREEEGVWVGPAGASDEFFCEAQGLGAVRLGGRRKGQPVGGRGAARRSVGVPPLTAEQRVLVLDTWEKSGLGAAEFARLVGVTAATLSGWKRKFQELGPAGLMDRPKGGPRGSRLSDLTRRTIVLMKRQHPEWGCQRISDMLMRGPALPASASAVARVLEEEGLLGEEERVSTPHGVPPVRHFERARPNQLWQTDIFTFKLKPQPRFVYLVAFMDDHSRFITGYGLHASASTALVIEALKAGIASYGPPQEVLTDNGPQYVTWRGKSQFTRHLERLGIRQIVSRPRRPQTLGKIERFWGSLWRECVEEAIFADLGDAQRRVGLWIDYYNFRRPHQGLEGLVPADRFFAAAPELLRTLQARVAASALELARHGAPREPFYITGQLQGESFSLHAEGDRVILHRGDEEPREVDLRSEAMVLAGASAGAQPALVLPEPVCPMGQVGSEPPKGELPEEPAGSSPVEEKMADWPESRGVAERSLEGAEQQPTGPRQPAVGRQEGSHE